MKPRFTKDIIINKFREIHNNKYNYENIVYKNINTPVNIYCYKCKSNFYQSPAYHLTGVNCKCYNSKLSLGTNKFIKNAISIYDDKYDYTKVEYINNISKVEILCNRCNQYFWKTPNAFITARSGCPTCGRKDGGKKIRINTEKFIIKAKLIHGQTKYNYQLSICNTSKDKVKILCNVCNKYFEQVVHTHLSGKGCSHCNTSKGELIIQNLLTKMNLNFKKQYNFKDCIDIRRLRFDIGFNIDNKIMLVEYQGEQHYTKFHFERKNDRLIDRKRRDKIKVDYCIKNNIPLLVIPYWEKKNCEVLIKKFIRDNTSRFPNFRGEIDVRNL